MEKIFRTAQLIQQSNYIVGFTGAGISTDSGIPDFRSHDCGLWNNVDPLVVASIYGFRRNPQAFYDWVRPLAEITINAAPNAAHLAFVQLEQIGKLSAIITQNIDMLHTRAGNTNIFELHGHLRQATCLHCLEVYDGEIILKQLLMNHQVPKCTACDNGVLKPNVVLFGEQLPFRELQAAQDASRKCDLMIIVGSSLEVAPASDLPVLAKRSGAKLIIINLDPTPIDHLAEVVIHGRAADVLPKIVKQVELKIT
ncbi:MAG: NAD-dependent protein deacylase [Phototrophicales bacterium]|nr:MAG: NAD-dependent protein deacylase [Phototrophicales bacterium]RMG71974.1 MAG: NAD-dependent deacylase [Chloroflexota bacterium]